MFSTLIVALQQSFRNSHELGENASIVFKQRSKQRADAFFD